MDDIAIDVDHEVIRCIYRFQKGMLYFGEYNLSLAIHFLKKVFAAPMSIGRATGALYLRFWNSWF